MSAPPDDERDASDLLQVYHLVPIKNEGDWIKLAEVLRDFSEVEEIQRRLAHLVKDVSLTVLIERQYIDKDYADTFSAYFSKRFHTPPSRCARVHLFRGQISQSQIRTLPKEELDYLGYSVLRPLATGGLGRTLISSKLAKAPDGKDRLHARSCEERVHILGRDFKVRGFPYLAQDTEVTVCAQAALWMIVRYFSNRYPHYKETGPHQLADLVSDFSLGRVFPSSGLSTWQASEILRRLGFQPVIHQRGGNSQAEKLAGKLGFNPKEPARAFEHLFYTYIESGIPLLVVYEDHAVVAFGHASDYSVKPEKSAASEEGFYHSSVWNKGFMVHDDAQFPYQFLDLSGSGQRPFKEVKAFIAPMPEKTFLAADEYQRLVRELLRSETFGWEKWAPELAEAGRKGEIVLRSFLTTGSSLKRSLAGRGMPPKAEEAYLHYSLPHFVWISEIHCLENYPDRCIGQVVWNATASSQDAEGFLFLHYPGVLIMNLTPHFNRAVPQKTDIRQLHLPDAGGLFTSFSPFGGNLSQTIHDHGRQEERA